MILPVAHTNKRKILFKFSIQFIKPVTISVIGYDEDQHSTVYFHREVRVDQAGTYDFDFPMPISPKRLRIQFGTADENLYNIVGVTTDFLPQAPVALDAEDIEYLKFIEWFSINAATLPTGKYAWPGIKYWINYLPTIIDEERGPISTPARIDHNNFGIEVAQDKVKSFTVPVTNVILVHEYTHGKYDTDDESFCDLNALRICLGLGFPKTECVYAFSNIFEDTDANIDRMNKIFNYAQNYRYSNG